METDQHQEAGDDFTQNEDYDDEINKENESEIESGELSDENYSEIPDVVRQVNDANPDSKRKPLDPEHDVHEYAKKIAKVFYKSENDRLNVENSELKGELQRQKGQIEALMQNRRKLIAREKDLINKLNGLKRQNEKQKEYIVDVLGVVSRGYKFLPE